MPTPPTTPQKLRDKWSAKTKYDKSVIIGSAVFLAAIAYYLALHRIFFTPDQFYFIALVLAIATGQVVSFVWDWTPLVLLILGYEFLRGLIPQINHHIHFELMPKFDLLVFGKLPTNVFQQALFNPNYIHWYDYLAVLFYLSHYIVPMIVGFVFWEVDRKYFREYALAILLLSYLTFLTYLAFPAAPPWMASQAGLIPPITHITDIIVSHLFAYIPTYTVYKYVGINLAAAVPSLHAAFPLLTALYIGKRVPKSWPILVMYVLGVWLSVIYLGEHYFFDVWLGIIYALFTYALVQRFKSWLKKKENGKFSPAN